ncbi:MAG TPA: hypothetical protein VKP52_06630 [Pseudolabrys sp.]|jgi:hypothetical protein|nr:hypothetical protein [Pseudolabrys sp.]
MSNSARGLFVCVLATTFIGGAALADAQAAKLSNADKIAIKQATVSCKAEARGKKIRWPKSRTYVKDCLKESLKDRPNVDLNKLDVDYRDMQIQQVKDPI